MTREPTTLDRVRDRCASNLGLVLAVLLILVVVGGWLTYATFLAPPTESEQRELGAIEAEGDYEYSATVRRENPAFPVGTELDDRRHFFRTVSPVLDGTYTYSASGSRTENVAVETELSLRLRATDGETEYWSVSEPLETDRREFADGAGTVEIPFSVNVTEADRRVAAIEQDLGRAPGDVEFAVVARTTVTGTVAGEQVENTDVHVLRIEPSGALYRVGQEGSGRSKTAVTEPTSAAPAYGPIRTYGSPLLFLLSSALLAVVGGLRYREALEPPADVRRTIREQRARRALDDWITTGRLPASRRSAPTVEVASLEGLVDVGIDSNRRIIEDPDLGRYFVIVDETVYAYDPGRTADVAADDAARVDSPGDAPDDVSADASGAGVREGGADDSFDWSDE